MILFVGGGGCGVLLESERGSVCGQIVLARKGGQIAACAIFFGLEGGGDGDQISGGRRDVFGRFVADLVVAPEIACVELSFGLGVVGFLEDLVEGAHDHAIFDGSLSEGGTDERFAECEPEFERSGEALVVGFGESFLVDGFEVVIPSDIGGELAEGRGGILKVLKQKTGHRAGEWGLSREGFGEQDAAAIDIGASIDGSDITAHLFGWHIGGATEHLPGHGELACSTARCSGDAKVHQLDTKGIEVFLEKDVGGFDIAVDDAVGLGQFESPTKLSKDDADFAACQATAFEDVFEGAAVEPFKDKEKAVLWVALAVDDLDDVGMFEHSEQAGFAEETLLDIFALCDGGLELFEGKAFAKDHVFDLVDGPVCASSFSCDHPVRTEKIAGVDRPSLAAGIVFVIRHDLFIVPCCAEAHRGVESLQRVFLRCCGAFRVAKQRGVSCIWGLACCGKRAKQAPRRLRVALFHRF